MIYLLASVSNALATFVKAVSEIAFVPSAFVVPPTCKLLTMSSKTCDLNELGSFVNTFFLICVYLVGNSLEKASAKPDTSP